jgi:putative transposase
MKLIGLKKNLKNATSAFERRNLIELNNKELTIVKQCELLNINRTTLYYKPKEIPESEIKIKHRIDELYTLMPFYGYRKITAHLKIENYNIGTSAVKRHMKEMGIRAIYPLPKTSTPNQQHKKYPYLLKGLDISVPNQVWGTDITYIRLKRGWLYLTAIIDWYSRYVISWELDQTLEINFVLENVDNALSIAKPQIINTDQGSHFTSLRFIEKFENNNARISMDGKGRALDNIITERLWRSVKYEEVYLNEYESPRDARIGISNYFNMYNNIRLHQSLGYKTPAQLYWSKL